MKKYQAPSSMNLFKNPTLIPALVGVAVAAAEAAAVGASAAFAAKAMKGRVYIESSEKALLPIG